MAGPEFLRRTRLSRHQGPVRRPFLVLQLYSCPTTTKVPASTAWPCQQLWLTTLGSIPVMPVMMAKAIKPHKNLRGHEIQRDRTPAHRATRELSEAKVATHCAYQLPGVGTILTAEAIGLMKRRQLAGIEPKLWFHTRANHSTRSAHETQPTKQ